MSTSGNGCKRSLTLVVMPSPCKRNASLPPTKQFSPSFCEDENSDERVPSMKTRRSTPSCLSSSSWLSASRWASSGRGSIGDWSAYKRVSRSVYRQGSCRPSGGAACPSAAAPRSDSAASNGCPSRSSSRLWNQRSAESALRLSAFRHVGGRRARRAREVAAASEAAVAPSHSRQRVGLCPADPVDRDHLRGADACCSVLHLGGRGGEGTVVHGWR
mmetsp:Transcript_10851/g.29541  ORF Transcript_10851/g.29541 Transcript_10851/m.29541 type:complete len:216 (-) Transcript_10851:74-721(-)